ncbi:putative LRR receptor-like serine/threonine-protein kinase At3g47570 [Castanea sativa]|uniref:putative LRR receptor-like serine/threonine-protein kinase At3g47570 n=1 Tax=Castanea sativa TaxID=21020 RepID=UPI003F653431
MRSNFFQRVIPSSFKSLRDLQVLDFSKINFSGNISKVLESFIFLQLLNLSYNDFDGEVPTNGVFKNTSATVIKGSNKLYGGMLKFDLSICKYNKSKKKKLTLSLKLIISIISSLLRVTLSPKATDAFSTSNLIGVDTFGSVYKGILDRDRRKVAVKVLNLLHHGAFKSFIAESSEYLHHHCHTPIAHCDLKPSNVLLNDEKIGHVEYDLGNEVSTYGDVYSYGILLLEMFTGRRPTDNIFKDNFNLHDFVKGALPEQVINIVDPIILWEREDMETRTNDTLIQNQIGSPKILECLILIFGIGVSCSMESLRERMNISDVVAQLHLIRVKLLKTRIR